MGVNQSATLDLSVVCLLAESLILLFQLSRKAMTGLTLAARLAGI